MLLTHLPNEIKIRNKVFKCVYGDYKEAKKEAISKGKNYRTVKVLSKTLRGRTDLHNRLYKPSVWLFVAE